MVKFTLIKTYYAIYFMKIYYNMTVGKHFSFYTPHPDIGRHDRIWRETMRPPHSKIQRNFNEHTAMGSGSFFNFAFI